MMSNRGLDMVRKLLQAAAAALALAPVTAQAATWAFHFETQNALLAPFADARISSTPNPLGETTAVGGLADGGTRTYDAAPISLGPHADNAGFAFTAGPYDHDIDNAFDSVGQIQNRPSTGQPRSDSPGEAPSAVGAPEPAPWLMLGLGFALLVGRRRSRQDRQAAFV